MHSQQDPQLSVLGGKLCRNTRSAGNSKCCLLWRRDSSVSPEAPEVWVKEALKGDGDAGCSVLCSVCISLGPPEKQNQQGQSVQSLSRVRLCATPWTVAHQAPLSMIFSRQEHWSGSSCPPPGDLPDPWIDPLSLASPALAGGFFTTEPLRKLPNYYLAISGSSSTQITLYLSTPGEFPPLV